MMMQSKFAGAASYREKMAMHTPIATGISHNSGVAIWLTKVS